MFRTIVGVGQLTKFQQVPTVTVEGGIPEACLAGEVRRHGAIVAGLRHHPRLGRFCQGGCTPLSDDGAARVFRSSDGAATTVR
jgi:hypothetical protein